VNKIDQALEFLNRELLEVVSKEEAERIIIAYIEHATAFVKAVEKINLH
jgi:hypothetical protein